MAKVVNLWIKYFWAKKENKKLLVTRVPTGLLPRVRSMWRETRFQLGEGEVGRVSREREERWSEEREERIQHASRFQSTQTYIHPYSVLATTSQGHVHGAPFPPCHRCGQRIQKWLRRPWSRTPCGLLEKINVL